MDNNIKIPSRTHYTISAGATIEIPILDDTGIETGTKLCTLAEDICVYVEGDDDFRVSDIETVD